MQKYMNQQEVSPNNCQQTNSSGNDESSSRSSRINSSSNNRDDFADGTSIGVSGFQFSQVPVNSFDGMNDAYGCDAFNDRRSRTTETEEEEGVID